MMNHRLFSNKNIFLSLFALFIGGTTFTSCSDDDNAADPYFYIEGQKTGITVDAKGIAKSAYVPLTIRSNRDWTVTLQNKADTTWIHLFADEGADDGIFRYWVSKNSEFTPRTANLIFTVNGQQQPIMYRIDQNADVPGVNILNAANGYIVLATGGLVKIPVTSNIAWTAKLSETTWAQIDSCSQDTVYITAQRNMDVARELTLTCTGEGEHAGITSATKLSQAGVGLFMNETFDWMQQGKEDFYYNYPEQNYTKWTAAEKSHGWTTMGDCMYGGRGYLKVGKTSDAGDLVSPKLSGILEPTNVVVTFQAIGYVATTGKKDDGVLKVGVIGPGVVESSEMGTIKIGDNTYNVAVLNVTVFPNSPKNENGENYNPWAQPGASFAVRIKGAAAEAQLVFIGGKEWGTALKGVGQGKNRLLLDNIKVKGE